ncbi:hypothetical protein Cpir12675_005025 [Ceratocystis pirilliformis]|uniref:Uncharacterized protein n=1 Tax=Ceratocystis pirilliformis TaxID=259994 RepID=A0ABR3YSK4_9PEZI
MHTGLPSSTIRSPLPTPLRTPLSSMPPTTHQPLTPLAPITPVALPPPPVSKIPKAADSIAIPPPIPPPGNKDSQMQQDFEYYKYTFGKPGLRGPNVRLHRPKSRV